ncbi:unnamed protein product [Prorocentrum cordatum]|uniref:Uncharacterized protein n=1 Tax=Prorocentrum cordatum TaxID=2364126 RepID=A0ABN9XHI6_9DINO|nr:unnamed protein product [Polarella glacialis]
MQLGLAFVVLDLAGGQHATAIEARSSIRIHTLHAMEEELNASVFYPSKAAPAAIRASSPQCLGLDNKCLQAAPAAIGAFSFQRVRRPAEEPLSVLEISLRSRP